MEPATKPPHPTDEALDIYSDLELSADGLAVRELREEIAHYKLKNETLQAKLSEELRARDQLKEENMILQRNISQLYNTGEPIPPPSSSTTFLISHTSSTLLIFSSFFVCHALKPRPRFAERML
jgi:hypothetical protein